MNALQGLRVWNTRPILQGQALNEAIRQQGGEVLHYPTFEIISTRSRTFLTLSPFLTIDIAIFTSANAVTHFTHLLVQKNILYPARILTIAIGKATAKALQQQGIAVHFTPPTANSETLLTSPLLQKVQGLTILLCKGVGGRTLLKTHLRLRGAIVQEMAIYRRKPILSQKAEIQELWRNRAADIILFTSQQALYHLFALLGEEGEHLRETACIVISERLKMHAQKLGMKKILLFCPETILSALYQFQQGLTHEHSAY